jgi:hypothetical protein
VGAAVLRPHHGEQPELREVRLSTEERDDPLVLVPRDAVSIENGLIEGPDDH